MNYTCELYFNKAVIKAKKERKQRISSFKQAKCHGDGFHSRVVCFGLGVEFFFFNSFEFILQGVFAQGLCSEALRLPPPLCPQARQACPWPLTWFAPHPSPASPPPCPHRSAATSSQMPELPPGALTTQGPAVLWCVWTGSEFGASVTRL